MSFAQEAELKAHFSNTPPRNADEVCAHILAEYGQSYCSSGAAKLMSRLGFEYRKPQVLPTRAAEAAQEAFIAAYEALMRRLDDDEMVVFSDAVHPTHQSRPAPRLVSQGSENRHQGQFRPQEIEYSRCD